MKYMNVKKKYQSFDLQLFADGDGGDGGDAGDGDDDPDDGEDDPDGDDDPEEKKFSQKDVDAAVKKRLEREKRKWKREQQKQTSGTDGKGKGGGDDQGTTAESEDAKARKAAEAKASGLEVKVACYEAGVAKDAVEDVAALARSYMAVDEDLDLEDAIEKVVKKYPQFKKAADDDNVDDGKKGKSWGERQRGRGEKLTGVEAAFLKKNPGLKI